MEWVKTRQLIAKRVLQRHLEKVEQQHQTVELQRHQEVRDVERDMRKLQRLRSGSVQITSTVPIASTSRRGSLPTLNPLLSNSLSTSRQQDLPKISSKESIPQGSSTPQLHENRYSSSNSKLSKTEKDFPVSDCKTLEKKKGPSTNSEVSQKDVGILELMTSTLQKAQTLEQERSIPSLPANFDTTSNQKLLNLSGSLGHGTNKASARAKLALEGHIINKKKPTLISADSSNCFANSNALSSEHSNQHGSLIVDFYDEDVGYPQDNSKSTSRSVPPLPLGELSQVEENEDELDDNSMGEGKDMDKNFLSKIVAEQEEDDVWAEIKKCRYIRGYDPPDMCMPKDPVSFVFHDNS